MEAGVRYAVPDLPLTNDEAAEALADSLDRVVIAEAEVGLQKLRLIADYDDRVAWKADGAASMAGWLCARYGVAWATAREWVRVSHALRFLPRISQTYGCGRLSWDQLRPLTRFATPLDDAYWAERAARMRPASLVHEAERRARVQREVLEEVRRIRSFAMWRDPERPVVYLEGRLPAEEGAAVEAALHRAARDIPLDPETEDPSDARLADALVAVVTRSGPDAGRADTTLVVHADAALLAAPGSAGRAGGRVGVRASEPGATSGAALAETEAGDRLTEDAVRRLACDARIDWVLERDGSPERIGTGGRAVPERLRRTLLFRDEGCRFPGCGTRRFVDAHHIVHWADGGPTTLDNLVTLCGFHHRLIHDRGWRISGHPGRDLRFHDPTGRRLPTHPEPVVEARTPVPLRR